MPRLPQMPTRPRPRSGLPGATLTGCSPPATLATVNELRKTGRFARWLDDLRDTRGRARIQARIERLAAGNPGDVAPVGEGVSELRVDVGP